MAKKQFKTESKKILDLMINSVYTNRDIFLRELISNASDAIDKLYYKSLTDDTVELDRDEFKIEIDVDKDDRVITITDNGIGMTEEELDQNLGIIAKSGSSLFKEINEKQQDISIIGQFGVGFYSAFMVAKEIRVKSLAFGSDQAYEWVSDGADGYTVSKCDKDEVGTEITLILKDNTETDSFDEYLDERRLKGIVKKYSDYIKYPIVMEIEDKEETLNSMIPIWKRSDSEVTEEEYNAFYSVKYYDFDAPLKAVHSKIEGQICYDSLLFVPSHAAHDYYTKEYEKKLVTYPRTDARVLSTAVAKEISKNLNGLIKGYKDEEVQTLLNKMITEKYSTNLTKTKYVNDSKITDHYAIIPTGQGYENFEKLPDLQKKVYNVIAKRFIAIFYPPAEYNKVTLTVEVENESFNASGKVCTNQGYLEVLKPKNNNKQSTEKEQTVENNRDTSDDAENNLEVFKNLKKGQEIEIKNYEIKDAETSPPSRYNSGSIILAMENAGKLIEDEELREQIKGAGIGTSATRGEIIKKLEKIKYIEINSKTQIVTPTKKGEAIYDVVNYAIPDMLNPKLTASWEKGLDMVAKKEIKSNEFMIKLENYINSKFNKLVVKM